MSIWQCCKEVPRSEMANVWDSSILLNEFEFQSRYCVHLWEKYEPPYLPTKLYPNCSKRMTQGLNDLRMLMCHQTKKNCQFKIYSEQLQVIIIIKK